MANDPWAEEIPDVADMMRLDGRVALVTGGGSGLGRMASIVLARAGATAVVTDIVAANAQSVAAEITGAGLKAVARRLDVTDEAEVVRVFAETADKDGPVDVLLNNAGTTGRAPTVEMTLETWNRVVDINLTGVFLCAREAGRQMLPRRSGSVINLGSIYGHVGGAFAGNPAYHATKGAVINLTRALAVEWGPHNVRCNAISPTFIDTPMTAPYFSDPEVRKVYEDLTPLRQIGKPHHLAGAVAYLASDASALVTGLSLLVDAGWTAR